MRRAYALLGLAFIIVFGGAYIVFEKAHAPIEEETDEATVTEDTPMALTLTSPAFEPNGTIPSQYTCDGANTIPPLAIEGAPEGTMSFVLVMDDPDIPAEIKASRGIEKFDHLAQYNIQPETAVIIDGTLPGDAALNSRGETGYTGPCPPAEYEPREHRYVFRLYALSRTLAFDETPTLDQVEAAAREYALADTELIGRYARE